MKWMICFAVMLYPATLVALVQEADVETKASAETVKVQVRPLVVYQKLDGVMESSNEAPVTLKSNGWSDFEIAELVPQGQQVSKGDQLIQFDSRAINKAVRDMELVQRELERDLAAKRLEAAQAAKRFELSKTIADQNMQNARDDYEYYLNVERPQRLKDLEYSLQVATYGLEYAQEELQQLMQMYNEDELTEESERIVLKRAQRSVDSAKRNLVKRRESVDKSKTVEIPREDFQQKNSLDQQTLDYAKNMLQLPHEKEMAKVALQKAEFALEEGATKLKELVDDRKLMTLQSPMNGLVYFGQNVNGKWQGVTGTASRVLELGKKIPANKVVMTIVDPNQLTVRGSLPEDRLSVVEVGALGKGAMKSDKNMIFSVELSSLEKVPSGTGTYACHFKLIDFENDQQKVLPGMNCSLALKLYSNDRASMVPKASVFSDNGIAHYVYKPDGQRQAVVLGFSDGDDVEVISGLKAGDSILKSKP